jgi:hypothetical protein
MLQEMKDNTRTIREKMDSNQAESTARLKAGSDANIEKFDVLRSTFVLRMDAHQERKPMLMPGSLRSDGGLSRKDGVQLRDRPGTKPKLRLAW